MGKSSLRNLCVSSAPLRLLLFWAHLPQRRRGNAEITQRRNEDATNSRFFLNFFERGVECRSQIYVQGATSLCFVSRRLSSSSVFY